MKASTIILALALGGLTPVLNGAETSNSIMDDEGTPIELDQPARRIISLAPSLTELVYAAGAGDRLVGVVEHSDYPPRASALPVIGRFDRLDVESILQLAPDLVIAWQSGNPRSTVIRLRQFGLTVYIAEPTTLAAIPELVSKLGMLAGTEAVAAAAVEEFEEQYNTLYNQFSHRAPVRTFYQVWSAPLITMGGNDLIDDIINLCGGRNVFAQLETLAPKVSVEAVLAADPEVIITSGIGNERPQWLDDWKQWPQLSAVAREQLFAVPPELVQRHTPRVLQGAAQVCAHIDSARRAR